MSSLTVYTWNLLDSVTPSPAVVDGVPAAPSVGRDVEIDRTSATREIVLSRGDLVLTKDAEGIAQDVDMRLRFVLGEFFADETVGVPYFERVLVKSPSESVIRSVFRKELLATTGVVSVLKLELSFDRAARKLSVVWTVQTDLGIINGTTSIPVNT